MNYYSKKFIGSDPFKKELWMATELKRLTFVVTPEMEEPLRSIKKEFYFDKTQSEMIRDLVNAGVRAFKADASEEPYAYDQKA